MKGHAYSTYTTMVYKILGLEKGKRDKYPSEIIDIIKNAEDLAKALVNAGKTYKDVKRMVEDAFSDKRLEVMDMLADIKLE